MFTYRSSNNLSCLLRVPYSKNFQLCLGLSPFHPPIHPALPSGLLCQAVLDATSQTYIIPTGLLCGSQCDGHPEPCKGFAETLALSWFLKPRFMVGKLREHLLRYPVVTEHSFAYRCTNADRLTTPSGSAPCLHRPCAFGS